MRKNKSKLDVVFEVNTVEEKKQSIADKIGGFVDIGKMASDPEATISEKSKRKPKKISKKVIVAVVILAVVILAVCIVSSIVSKKPHYDSYCRGNITIKYVISDYSSLDTVKLYIDGENCKTLEPGDKYKSQEMIGVGTHEIMVKRGGLFGTKETKSFSIDEDSYIDCSIDVGEDAIIISDVQVETEEERAERIEREELARKVFKYSVNVFFNENIFLNIYDVDIYVDDERLGTISQGDTFTQEIELHGGEHVLRFEKICTSDDDEPASGSRKFKLNTDMYLSCDITSYYSEIRISDVVDETYEEHDERIAKEEAERKAEEAAKAAEEREKAEAEERERKELEAMGEAEEKMAKKESKQSSSKVNENNATSIVLEYGQKNYDITFRIVLTETYTQRFGKGYGVVGKCTYKVNGNKVKKNLDSYVDDNGKVTKFNVY